MLKIVHTADIHAGKPLSFELEEERRYIRRREIETTLWRIVDFAREENAQILLIAGDLFEHLYARPSWVKDAASLFSTIPETRVFMAPGNHDPLLPDSLYYSVDWPENVTVFDSAGLSRVSFEVNGIELDVYGLGWTTFVQRTPLIQGFKVERRDRLNIVLLHGDLAEESVYLPVSQEHIANSGADYFALGHIHAPWPGVSPAPPWPTQDVPNPWISAMKAKGECTWLPAQGRASCLLSLCPWPSVR